MTIKECYNYIVDRVLRFEDEREARSIAYILLEELLSITKRDLILSPESEVASRDVMEKAIDRLEKGEPIEHITGRREFYGRQYKVSPSVLIPRPETEELVKMATNLFKGGSIIDIGTGSGAIACTMALECREAEVEACDISKEALAVAQENSATLGAKVDFFHLDILSGELPCEYNMIISNPPYIRESERVEMSPKVYDHEPLIALFVEDSDPLIFYRTIAERAQKSLKSGGWLLFEINEALGDEMSEMLSGMGFSDVEIHRDLFDKDRMSSCRKR